MIWRSTALYPMDCWTSTTATMGIIYLPPPQPVAVAVVSRGDTREMAV